MQFEAEVIGTACTLHLEAKRGVYSSVITPTGEAGCIHSTNIKNSQIFFNSMHFAYKQNKNLQRHQYWCN
jgi:hypothetical protein